MIQQNVSHIHFQNPICTPQGQIYHCLSPSERVTSMFSPLPVPSGPNIHNRQNRGLLFQLKFYPLRIGPLAPLFDTCQNTLGGKVEASLKKFDAVKGCFIFKNRLNDCFSLIFTTEKRPSFEGQLPGWNLSYCISCSLRVYRQIRALDYTTFFNKTASNLPSNVRRSNQRKK